LKEAVQVAILGQEYTVRSDAPAEEVQRVAVFVGERISEVMKAGKIADSLDGAVLALMNVAGAYLRLQNRDQESQEFIRRLEHLVQRLETANHDESSPQEQAKQAQTHQGSLYGDFLE
jgi:cell division protein ZapA